MIISTYAMFDMCLHPVIGGPYVSRYLRLSGSLVVCILHAATFVISSFLSPGIVISLLRASFYHMFSLHILLCPGMFVPCTLLNNNVFLYPPHMCCSFDIYSFRMLSFFATPLIHLIILTLFTSPVLQVLSSSPGSMPYTAWLV